MDKITEIEQLMSETLSRERAWPFLRLVYGQDLMNKDRGLNSRVRQRKGIHITFTKLKIALSGVGSLFRKYDYVFIGPSDNFKIEQDYSIDRLVHGYIDELGIGNCLYIEDFVETTDRRKVPYKRITYHLVVLLSKLFLFSKKQNVNDEVMNQVCAKLQSNLPYQKHWVDFQKKVEALKLIFKLLKPKVVFVTCYTHKDSLLAANILGIRTVEFQHGVIMSNYGYRYERINSHMTNPDYVIVYGHKDLEYLAKCNYTNNIRIGGNYYVDYVKNIADYRWSEIPGVCQVLVTIQKPVRRELYTLLLRIAPLLPSFMFLIAERNGDRSELITDCQNISYAKEGFYKAANFCDIHLTSYSSCCIEAPRFGLLNIFINYYGRSMYYYKDYINEKSFNYISSPEPEDVCTVLMAMKRRQYNKGDVALENSDYLAAYKFVSSVASIDRKN